MSNERGTSPRRPRIEAGSSGRGFKDQRFDGRRAVSQRSARRSDESDFSDVDSYRSSVSSAQTAPTLIRSGRSASSASESRASRSGRDDLSEYGSLSAGIAGALAQLPGAAPTPGVRSRTPSVSSRSAMDAADFDTSSLISGSSRRNVSKPMDVGSLVGSQAERAGVPTVIDRVKEALAAFETGKKLSVQDARDNVATLGSVLQRFEEASNSVESKEDRNAVRRLTDQVQKAIDKARSDTKGVVGNPSDGHSRSTLKFIEEHKSTAGLGARIARSFASTGTSIGNALSKAKIFLAPRVGYTPLDALGSKVATVGSRISGAFGVLTGGSGASMESVKATEGINTSLKGRLNDARDASQRLDKAKRDALALTSSGRLWKHFEGRAAAPQPSPTPTVARGSAGRGSVRGGGSVASGRQ